MPGESAEEGIARPGGIRDFREREGGAAEETDAGKIGQGGILPVRVL